VIWKIDLHISILSQGKVGGGIYKRNNGKMYVLLKRGMGPKFGTKIMKFID
jgi:hypothetical protein